MDNSGAFGIHCKTRGCIWHCYINSSERKNSVTEMNGSGKNSTSWMFGNPQTTITGIGVIATVTYCLYVPARKTSRL